MTTKLFLAVFCGLALYGILKFAAWLLASPDGHALLWAIYAMGK